MSVKPTDVVSFDTFKKLGDVKVDP